MKKQINPTIKAHLLRGAFYLLLLLAVCAIPFALAQRNATKPSVATPPAKPNLVLNSATEGPQAAPAYPRVGCGLLVGDGLTIGYAPNNFTTLANNIVNYTFANSQTAPNDFAIFQTHDPWGATVVKTAITNAGHTYTVFTPANLVGFNFNNYRVVILNWDDTNVNAFDPPYSSVIPALQTYVSGGGVVWVQGAIQSLGGTSYPLPFGGTSNHDIGNSDPIVDPSSPMVQGVPNPIVGSSASHVSDTALPGDAHVVVVNSADNLPVLYDLRRGTCGPTPTATPTAAATATATPTPTATVPPRQTPAPRPRPTPPPRP